MPRRKSSRTPASNKYAIVRNLSMPNVLWVNFEDPTQLHPAVREYADSLVKKQINETEE